MVGEIDGSDERPGAATLRISVQLFHLPRVDEENNKQTKKTLPSKELCVCLVQSFVLMCFLRDSRERRGEERRVEEGETSHSRWISQHLGDVSLLATRKDQRAGEHFSPTPSPLGAGGFGWRECEVSSRRRGEGGWVAQFADKLPFREAREDLRAFFLMLGCGWESFRFDGVQVP